MSGGANVTRNEQTQNRTHPPLPDGLGENAKPADVARHDSLSIDERRRILVQWREDQLALVRAQAEGMQQTDPAAAGSVAERLTQIESALATLES